MQTSAMHAHTFGFGEETCETCGMPFCETHGDAGICRPAVNSVSMEDIDHRAERSHDAKNSGLIAGLLRTLVGI